MAKEIKRQSIEDYSREDVLGFPKPFQLAGNSDLTVESLFLVTEGRLTGNYLVLEQTLSGKANSSNPARGLNGKIGLVYQPSRIEVTLPENHDELTDTVKSYHKTRIAEITQSYDLGLSLPQTLGSLELIKS